jgi:hypothetical protein
LTPVNTTQARRLRKAGSDPRAATSGYALGRCNKCKARRTGCKRTPVRSTLKDIGAEIGSYPCIELDTASRTLSPLQQQGLPAVDKRRKRIIDPQALQCAFGMLLR